MSQYLPLVVLFALAVLFGVVSFIASKLLNPARPTAAKVAPYESGIVPSKGSVERFPVRFYLVAMLFIMFDIEIIFLYPYALQHRELGAYGLWAMVIFSVIFFLSFVYEVARGGLDWGPARRDTPIGAIRTPGRTAMSTVRRVGAEGREHAA